MAVKDKLWVEKYRPKTLDKYAFQDGRHKEFITRCVEEMSIPNLLFYGVQGTGKTTLARILVNSCGIDEFDVLEVNASDNRGIDTFRDTIKSFAGTVAMGMYKVVILEEADQLTPDAQKALKSFMEDMNEYCRFILTCNSVNKIIPPIRSRCQEFLFKASNQDDIAEYLVMVLSTEKVKFKLDTLYKYIDFAYPDIRKILNTLQQNCFNGVLKEPELKGETGEYRFQLLDMLNESKWSEARELLCNTVPDEEWPQLFTFLYQNIHKVEKFQKKALWEEAIVLINDHMDKHSRVEVPEINGAALMIRLSMLK